MEEIIVPTVMFGVIGGVFWLIHYFRFRGRQEVQQTLRTAMDSGQTLSPETIARLTETLDPPKSDLRRGVISVALAIALLIVSRVVPDQEAARVLLGLMAFPFFVGLAYLILWRLPPRPSAS